VHYPESVDCDLIIFLSSMFIINEINTSSSDRDNNNNYYSNVVHEQLSGFELSSSGGRTIVGFCIIVWLLIFLIEFKTSS
jgi:hypothetical protein